MDKIIEVITHPVFLWIVGVLLAIGLAIYITSYFVASHLVYVRTLKRPSKEAWSRDVPSELEERAVKMYNEGVSWAEQNSKYKHDLHIVRDGVNLYGEYYDFGSDKCVFVLSGRTEALKYGYYFAIPYYKCGYNVLVVDPRAHGLSDGEYNTVGFEESRDAIAWINHIQEKFNVKSVVLHGICIGAAGGILALTAKNSPSIVSGIVTDGMFINFAESVKNHLIERKKPVFLMLGLISWQMKRRTGFSMKVGPIDYIDKLDKPLLMLHSKEDIYSTPSRAEELFNKAGSKVKQIVWFEKGEHSMLRYTDTNRYDSAIATFIKNLDNK